jgi:hypothetical protein
MKETIMNKRFAKWQEMIRTHLELQLIPVPVPVRARRTPVLFTGGERNWYSQLPVSRGKLRSH